MNPSQEQLDNLAATAAQPEESLWSAVKESLRGSHRNYTTGPIGRAILLLAIPMVLEMVMESVFVMVLPSGRERPRRAKMRRDVHVR